MYSPFPGKRYLAGYILAFAVFSFIMSSCGTTRPYIYMQGKFDTAALRQVKITDPVIQKGDLISIVVYSDNPEATKIYNQTLITTGGNSAGSNGEGAVTSVTGSAPSSPGYQVDENGNIEFQGLGLLHIEGLTRLQLKGLLDSKLKDTLLTNPYYNIRFLNNRFTMLGEITKPGIYSIPSEHINLLEALALCGDMTFYARRDNVLIIREKGGKREWARLDVTKPDLMASPYYYIQQNDIIYIEQDRKKSAVSDQLTTRNIGIASAIIYAIALVYSILKK